VWSEYKVRLSEIWETIAGPLQWPKVLNFQQVSGQARFRGNKLADSIAKAKAILPSTKVPFRFAPVGTRHPRYSTWRWNIFHKFLFCQTPQFLHRADSKYLSQISLFPDSLSLYVELALSGSYLYILWNDPYLLLRSQHSVVLCLRRIKKEGRFFLQRLQSSATEFYSSSSGLSQSEHLRGSNFFITSSIFYLWSRPWGIVMQTVESPWIFSIHPFLERPQVTPLPWPNVYRAYLVCRRQDHKRQNSLGRGANKNEQNFIRIFFSIPKYHLWRFPNFT